MFAAVAVFAVLFLTTPFTDAQSRPANRLCENEECTDDILVMDEMTGEVRRIQQGPHSTKEQNKVVDTAIKEMKDCQAATQPQQRQAECKQARDAVNKAERERKRKGTLTMCTMGGCITCTKGVDCEPYAVASADAVQDGRPQKRFQERLGEPTEQSLSWCSIFGCESPSQTPTYARPTEELKSDSIDPYDWTREDRQPQVDAQAWKDQLISTLAPAILQSGGAPGVGETVAWRVPAEQLVPGVSESPVFQRFGNDTFQRAADGSWTRVPETVQRFAPIDPGPSGPSAAEQKMTFAEFMKESGLKLAQNVLPEAIQEWLGVPPPAALQPTLAELTEELVSEGEVLTGGADDVFAGFPGEESASFMLDTGRSRVEPLPVEEAPPASRQEDETGGFSPQFDTLPRSRALFDSAMYDTPSPLSLPRAISFTGNPGPFDPYTLAIDERSGEIRFNLDGLLNGPFSAGFSAQPLSVQPTSIDIGSLAQSPGEISASARYARAEPVAPAQFQFSDPAPRSFGQRIGGVFQTIGVGFRDMWNRARGFFSWF